MGTGQTVLIDAHLHLQDARLKGSLPEVIGTLRAENIGWWGVNGTSPSDWKEVARLTDAYAEVKPFFGVHPWKVNSTEDSWAEDLTSLLERFPHAGVGEIGLDRWVRDHDIPRQKDFFAQQLQIAQRLQRPVAVHCLQAWGHLCEILEARKWNRPFLLHSYSGPVEMLPQFLEMGAYFSISGYFFREEKRSKLEIFRSIPRDRILLETDAPDMLPPARMRRFSLPRSSDEESEDRNHPANLTEIYEAYASWSSQTKSEVVDQMKANCNRWIADPFSSGS